MEPNNFDNDYEYIQNKQFWLNHIDENGEVVANSNLGAKCKVEVISKNNLLRARGYKVDDIGVNVLPVDEVDTSPQDDEFGDGDDNDIVVDVVDDIEITNPSNEELPEEETFNVESMPFSAPIGFNPMTNPMTGTLSPQGQWEWNGVSMTWIAVETQEEETEEEESSEPIATNTPDDIINFGAGGGNY